MWRLSLSSSYLLLSPCCLQKGLTGCTVTKIVSLVSENSGEDKEMNPKTEEKGLKEVRMRRITPKHLSIAVSKRRKKSRPLPDHDQIQDKQTFARKYLRQFKTEYNGNVHNLRFRYDKTLETNELVDYLTNRFGNDKSILEPFQDMYIAPSVIGVDRQDIDKCFDELTKVGFTKDEAVAILPYLPFCLEKNMQELKEMCDILECHGIGWRSFLREHCHCLFNATTIVKENILLMKRMGMSPQVMRAVLKYQPMLFTCLIDEGTVQNILSTKEKGFNNQWVDNAMKQALLHRPSKVILGEDTTQLIHILKQFKISPDFLLRRYPDFFKMKAHHFISLLEVMCGPPLYLDSTLVATILTTCPHHIVTIASPKDLRTHLDSLYKLFTGTASIQYTVRHINRVPSLISPEHMIDDKTSVFKRAGFSTDGVSILFNRAPSMLMQHVEELEERISLLLNLKGSSPDAITKATSTDPTKLSAGFLVRNINDIRARVNYCKKYDEVLLCIENLQDLFGSSHSNFASLFNHTGVQFLRECSDEHWIDEKEVNHRVTRMHYSNMKKKKKKTGEIDKAPIEEDS